MSQKKKSCREYFITRLKVILLILLTLMNIFSKYIIIKRHACIKSICRYRYLVPLVKDLVTWNPILLCPPTDDCSHPLNTQVFLACEDNELETVLLSELCNECIGWHNIFISQLFFHYTILFFELCNTCLIHVLGFISTPFFHHIMFVF
jgi:hypothetical protein